MTNQTSTNQRKILNISLPSRLYFEVEKLARKEAKTKSELARDLFRQRLQEEKEWAEIRRWGAKTAKRLGIKNEDDVERIVDEIRSEK